jgi:transposase
MLYLAIDQHSKQLTVCLRNEEGDVIGRRQVSTRWEAVRKFFQELSTSAAEDGGWMAIVEVCGFNRWLLELLGEYQCRQIVLVQAEKKSKQKTDHRDAHQLGAVLWTHRQRLLAGKRIEGLRVVQPASAQDEAARQLTELRKRLSQRRTRTLNGIEHLLLKHNLQQERPTKGAQTKRSRIWLRELQLPPIDRLELDQLLDQWELWDQQLERVNTQIERLQKQYADAAVLATIPGTAAYSSLSLACRVGGIERFARPESLANYWGLAPGSNSSGQSTRIGSITKQGSGHARFILGQLVMHVLRRDPWMRQWYKQIKLRRGSKIARVAVMRRLTCIIWHMLKHRQPYQCGGPLQHREKISLA